MLKNSITGKKTIIYCRISSKSQTEGTSLDEQEKLCMDYAKQYHLKALLAEREGEDE